MNIISKLLNQQTIKKQKTEEEDHKIPESYKLICTKKQYQLKYYELRENSYYCKMMESSIGMKVRPSQIECIVEKVTGGLWIGRKYSLLQIETVKIDRNSLNLVEQMIVIP